MAGYVFRIYIIPPGGTGPWWGLGKLGQLPDATHAAPDPTGHTFVSLTTPDGVTRDYGFYPDLTFDDVGTADNISGDPGSLFKDVKGALFDGDGAIHTVPPDDVLTYNITKAQYDAMNAYIQGFITSTPRAPGRAGSAHLGHITNTKQPYNMANCNCTTFAEQVAVAGKVWVPPNAGVFASPAGLKDGVEALRQVEQAALKVAVEILKATTRIPIIFASIENFPNTAVGLAAEACPLSQDGAQTSVTGKVLSSPAAGSPTPSGP